MHPMEKNAKLANMRVAALAAGLDEPRLEAADGPTNPSDVMQRILPEDLFLGLLCLDRKRAERSGKRLALVLIDAEDARTSGRKHEILNKVMKAANVARRETDPAGWYKHDAVLGIIFSELGTADTAITAQTLIEKVREALVLHLSKEDRENVYLSIHVFADDQEDRGSGPSVNEAFYPDLFQQHKSRRLSLVAKRCMDIAISLAVLILFSPVYLAIAIAVKLSSKGPVFFKQERLGQFGKTFKCLKFRSMVVNNDLKIHQKFIEGVINGTNKGETDGQGAPVYKMTNDPRITRIGRFIRRTSLDELPQFINILRGEMSLVGPRPPLAYEYAVYDIWHRRRVLEVKPGLTGLWQVRGRSRVRFDDMVRLDLRYAREWSLWLDMRIILETPRVVVFGDGAY